MQIFIPKPLQTFTLCYLFWAKGRVIPTITLFP